MNPFESGERKNVPAVLIYARSLANGVPEVLMIHRNSPKRGSVDYHSGRWNGLGGKSELNESAQQSACREFLEEAGIELHASRFKPLGCLQFPAFKAHKNEDWTVFVFVLDLSSEERAKVVGTSDEGDLHWIVENDLMKLNLWPGDCHFISYVVARKPFQGAIWYKGSEVEKYEIQEIGFQ